MKNIKFYKNISRFAKILLILLMGFSYSFAQRKHVVVEGNTLSGLAKQYYGSYQQWQIIYEANKDRELEVIDSLSSRKRTPRKLKNPKYIYPGQVLIIPNLPEDSLGMDTDSTLAIEKTPIETRNNIVPRYNVSARVTADKKPLADVKVKYTDAENTLKEIYTDSLGDFTANKIPDGTVLEFSKKGYLPQTAKVKAGRIEDIVLISESQAVDAWTVKGTVKLRKKPNKPAKNAKSGNITIAGQTMTIQKDGTFEGTIANKGQQFLKVEATDISQYTLKENFLFEVLPTEKLPKPASLEIILDKQ